MLKEKKPHIILKFFNKNGGESEFTKIITEENEANYAAQLKGLPEDEKGLLMYHKDKDNWFLITKRRVRSARDGEGYELLLEDMKTVRFCMESPEAYLRKFILTDKDDNDHTVYFDERKAFDSMTQVLFFLATP
ncbi:hypothetical protein [Chitinophaga sp.]|uniref:hypothetical protein n=1 Tax=Chitinophaga sp. TaxID=1869181 RepID=UPI0031DCED78